MRNSMRLSGTTLALRSIIAALDFDGTVHCVDHTAKLDDAAVAGALDDAAVMDRDGRVDQVAPERPKAGEDSFLIDAGQPR